MEIFFIGLEEEEGGPFLNFEVEGRGGEGRGPNILLKKGAIEGLYFETPARAFEKSTILYLYKDIS